VNEHKVETLAILPDCPVTTATLLDLLSVIHVRKCARLTAASTFLRSALATGDSTSGVRWKFGPCIPFSTSGALVPRNAKK
jgi:hypothetical protein